MIFHVLHICLDTAKPLFSLLRVALQVVHLSLAFIHCVLFTGSPDSYSHYINQCHNPLFKFKSNLKTPLQLKTVVQNTHKLSKSRILKSPCSYLLVPYQPTNPKMCICTGKRWFIVSFDPFFTCYLLIKNKELLQWN